ncbi:putative UPF0505 family protein [Lupinus albus]|uniref:Putative UPF0505 family protein n=1 Tax=Lupinus albus TaxID=3870 RepID=A0A6A4NVM1_LUPAL|nr:putative UPF0505 family protein [Lupinus albus]
MMEFRARDYTLHLQSHALPRVPTHSHPLSSPSSQVIVVHHDNSDFFDPLRRNEIHMKTTLHDAHKLSQDSDHHPPKEWTSFRRLLMHKFPVSKMVSISSMPDVLLRSGKSQEKSSISMHLEELDGSQKFEDGGAKVITWQVYVSRLHELKDEINRSWLAEDRVTSLRLSIKVAKLLMDTSVSEFYPTLFVLVTDIMDMLGDLVWQRIRRKAEFSEEGTLLCNLPENFGAIDICADAKETCNNWFVKIGSVQEVLPRIYLELAILPCWRFLLDQPADSLRRLVMMIRGLGDPVASAYCRLYMAHCAQKLPAHDIGYLVTCVNDITVILMQMMSAKESTHGNVQSFKELQVSQMEPTIEYIMKCIFNGLSQRQVTEVLTELGFMKSQQDFPKVSIVLHHLLKELPIEVVCSNALQILHLIEFSKDSSFDQHMNYRLVGFRLYEMKPSVDVLNAVLDKVIQVITQYESLDKYLTVVDAYADLILQNQMVSLSEWVQSLLNG